MRDRHSGRPPLSRARSRGLPRGRGSWLVRRGALLVALALTGSGCASRQIAITSDPPGARVTLEEEELGTTPLTYAFRYGGVRDFLFRLPGHETVLVRHDSYRWEHDAFPVDVFTDLTPLGGDDRQTLHVVLPKGRTTRWSDHPEAAWLEREALEARADQLRRRLERAGSRPAPRAP